MRSALVLTRNSRDAVTQGHALHRNAVTQRHALLRDAVTQLTLSCASFSRASSSRFSARVWRHCLRELQLTHTQNANLQMRIRSRRQALLPGHVPTMRSWAWCRQPRNPSSTPPSRTPSGQPASIPRTCRPRFRATCRNRSRCGLHRARSSVPALACGDRVRGGADPGAGVGAVTLSLS